jgi:riboflavin biosynthesis pyrimidine reductase
MGARNDGFVPATCADQIFNVDVIVVGDDTVEADRRTVVVRVPGDRSLCTP